MKVLLREKGQASLEYVGVVVAGTLVVLALVLFATGLGSRIVDRIDGLVCEIVGGECTADSSTGDPPESAASDPELSSADRDALLSADPQDAQGVLAGLSPEELAWLEQNDPSAYAAAVEARSWGEQRELVDGYTSGELEDFIDHKGSGERDERLDYSDDGCSAPVVGSTGISFDFTEACERHDFGYRNYKNLGLFDEEKGRVDEQFLEDMLDHCEGRSFLLRGRCTQWAYTFYAGVTGLGGNCDPPGPIGRVPGPCAPEDG